MYKLIVRLRSKLLVLLTHNMALPLLKLIRRPVKFPYTKEALVAFAAGTLGHDLIVYLEERKLQLLPYYAKHDIKHILLQYDTSDEGEVCLQCFMLGNGHLSFPVIATVLYGTVTMPEYWAKFKKAYNRGKHCAAIADWDWFRLLPLPTQQLINKINTHEAGAA
jgi:ubiquinone biosynthesis protein Coq4